MQNITWHNIARLSRDEKENVLHESEPTASELVKINSTHDDENKI